MVLRLAWFVLVHEIPTALVLNGDHTGIMFTLAKGKMWITKAMAKAKDKSVNNHGEKRQFTLLTTTSAEGQMLPHQVVVSGKTAASFPAFGKFAMSLSGLNSAGCKQPSVCFVLTTIVAAVANIASWCVTSNHWSDDVTSRVYICDIVVPYFKKKIDALHAAGKCKAYGEQVCVLIIDCWYGWLVIIPWIKVKYPWIRVIVVPASCTPVAQPMDRGIIAKLKALLRKIYNKWVIRLVTMQLAAGTAPNAVKVPADVPTCKSNLLSWLSAIVDRMNEDRASVIHCWKETQLLRAWERSVQVEATSKLAELFPNMAHLSAEEIGAIYRLAARRRLARGGGPRRGPAGQHGGHPVRAARRRGRVDELRRPGRHRGVVAFGDLVAEQQRRRVNMCRLRRM